MGKLMVVMTVVATVDQMAANLVAVTVELKEPQKEYNWAVLKVEPSVGLMECTKVDKLAVHLDWLMVELKEFQLVGTKGSNLVDLLVHDLVDQLVVHLAACSVASLV